MRTRKFHAGPCNHKQDVRRGCRAHMRTTLVTLKGAHGDGAKTQERHHSCPATLTNKKAYQPFSHSPAAAAHRHHHRAGTVPEAAAAPPPRRPALWGCRRHDHRTCLIFPQTCPAPSPCRSATEHMATPHPRRAESWRCCSWLLLSSRSRSRTHLQAPAAPSV